MKSEEREREMGEKRERERGEKRERRKKEEKRNDGSDQSIGYIYDG